MTRYKGPKPWGAEFVISFRSKYVRFLYLGLFELIKNKVGLITPVRNITDVQEETNKRPGGLSVRQTLRSLIVENTKRRS